MTTRHILLLCILGAALLSSVSCRNEVGPDDCCFDFYPRPLNKKYVRSYYMADRRCTKAAVILVSMKGRNICTDPRLQWVDNLMKRIDESTF
ncbi:C-C motif chemokine 36.1 [Nelusetta ayraudi]|uniref:C-C motif chemokine 36.1 n=1 Tax=Nelusetta ayraudi TaxID=303726 RepID=UPI003F70154E